ncbi:histidine phosphatase family protein [Paenibacillus sabuli]|nr:histidine phosphatase family protein [Paenibacillus sabuli]
MRRRSADAAPIYLLRHGRTAWNAERRYGGHTDLPLLGAPVGKADAGLTDAAERLRAVRFARVYCSDLLRARQTLQRVRPELPETAHFDARLRELDFGAWEGMTYEQLCAQDAYRAWLDDPRRGAPPGGESLERLERRLRRFAVDARLLMAGSGCYRSSRRPGGPIRLPRLRGARLIVSHGGPIRLLLTLLVPDLALWSADVPCGSLHRVQDGRAERLV